MDPITLAMSLAQFAPAIVKWMTGSDKAGEAATKVVAVAEAVTGQKGANVLASLNTDPSLVLQFRDRIADRELELDKAYLLDRSDARARDFGLANAGRTNHRADLLAVLAVGSLVFCVWIVASDSMLPTGAREAVMFVAGVFASAVRDVYGFEFGSSRGSKEKDELMARMKK